MNKKFITLCVSALLAGGMVTPAFAELKTEVVAATIQLDEAEDTQYYAIKLNANGIVTSSNLGTTWNLKGTFAGYTLTNALDGYSLWRITEHKDANGNVDGYQFVNAYGIPLAIKADAEAASGYSLDKDGSISVFALSGNGNNLVAKATKADGTQVQLYVNQLISTVDVDGNVGVSTTGQIAYVGFCAPASTHLSASELKGVFGDHFALQIGKYNDKGEFEEYALEGNAFVGNLIPFDDLKASTNSGASLIKPLQGNGETYLKNENNEVLVLLNQKWNIQNTDLTPGATDELKGYKFTTMTAQELGATLLADENKSAAEKTIKSYIFRVSGINAHINDIAAPLEVAVKLDMDDNATTSNDYNAETWAELLVAGVDETYYLTTATAGNNESGDKKLDLSVADYTENTYVRFGENNFLNAADFWGKAWNIVRESDEKTIVPNTTNDWVEKEKIGFTVPEGQWILFESAKKQQWINRETGVVAELPFASLRSTDKADTYQITSGDFKGTYRITEAAVLGGNHTEYYGADVEESTVGHTQTYKITFTNEVTGETAYLGMNAVGQILLKGEPTEAINFQVSKVQSTDNTVIVSDEDIDANVDVFNIYNDFMKYDADKKAWVEDVDTLSFNRYYFSIDGKYLNYDPAKGYILVDPKDHEGEELTDYVNAYVIKEKGDDFVNIINLNADYSKDFDDIQAANRTGDVIFTGSNKDADAIEMMYFDFNFAEALQQQNIYNWTSNAQLKLDDTKSAIYRNVAPYAPDTMAIYRIEYTDEFLFEKGDFLGMTVDERGYNAALFIDTAYVRNNTEKPLFMIGLRPEFTPMSTYCPEHGFNTDCPPQHLDTIPGYVDADYLTVMADSAAANADLLQNPWLANAEYTKLAFVQARHNVDTITVAENEKKVVITEGKQDPMLFAFRYVNNETGDFIIEGVDLKDNKDPKSGYETAWIRWNNGVPVMTNQMKDAEVFNIAEVENGNPTANEAITAEEGAVSVVATEGGVIVKGAEGKNVVVATILGKVVANETVNSDNETINTPAGIVVVSVDGESFKVVVK